MEVYILTSIVFDRPLFSPDIIILSENFNASRQILLLFKQRKLFGKFVLWSLQPGNLYIIYAQLCITLLTQSGLDFLPI